MLLFRGEPQIYGTQYKVKNGVAELWTVRDPEGLDARRASLGLEPEHENRARLLARRTDTAPDPGAGTTVATDCRAGVFAVWLCGCYFASGLT